MAITSGFFDSVSGDRTYDADQMSNYFDGLVSNGVYETIGDRFLVSSANNGMNINVGSGRAIIQSHWVKNDSSTVLTLDPSDVQLNRIDAIVLRLDTSAREITLTVKKGTAVSGSPSMPTITQNDTVYELYLASVYVAKGATQPTSITDLRPSSYCGWVTGIITQVNTADLFNQWQNAYSQQYAEFDAYMAAKQAEFETWYSNLTSQLRVDTTIHRYQNSYQITTAQANAKKYPVGISEYNADEDILFVIVDGIIMTEGVDYNIMKYSEHYPDVNGDDRVDELDSSMILSAASHIAAGQPSGLTAEQEKAADPNMDGIIDSLDSNLVLSFAAACADSRYENTVEGWNSFFEDTFGITIDSDYYITSTSTFRAGSQLTFMVIKSVIGEGDIEGVPVVICTQAEYDAMASHDAGTIYIISG